MKAIETPWSDRLLVLEAEGEAPPRQWFTDSELREAASFRLPRRRDEWLLSRAAAKQLASALGLCGGPRDCSVAGRRLIAGGRETGWNVSISHSAPWAAAAISSGRIGVDVQVVRPFQDDAARLFLSADEIEAMQRCSIAHRLLHFWCAKEAAWKRRSAEFATLRQVPIALVAEEPHALHFTDVETILIGELIVAISPPVNDGTAL